MQIIPEKQAEYKAYTEKNSDPYSHAVVTYTERWAELMEKAISDGKELEDIAQALSREADTEGITGFMYGCAVSALASFWIHGDRLRRWHNLKYQLKDEGEKANQQGSVLNPAVLNIKI